MGPPKTRSFSASPKEAPSDRCCAGSRRGTRRRLGRPRSSTVRQDPDGRPPQASAGPRRCLGTYRHVEHHDPGVREPASVDARGDRAAHLGRCTLCSAGDRFPARMGRGALGGAYSSRAVCLDQNVRRVTEPYALSRGGRPTKRTCDAISPGNTPHVRPCRCRVSAAPDSGRALLRGDARPIPEPGLWALRDRQLCIC